MRKFEVGDVVRVVSERPYVQENYVAWVDSMDVCLGAIGKVDRIDGFGNLGLAGVEWWLHPKWVEIATSSLESDPINHPAHYAGSNGIECIDAMRATLTPDEFRGYCKGAAFKYIWRERQKGGNESLAKAVWYLNEAQK